jgi:7-keto-8-aminopelargonate synthetase-like enzyme
MSVMHAPPTGLRAPLLPPFVSGSLRSPADEIAFSGEGGPLSQWGAANFGCLDSSSYLGFSNDARVKAAAKQAIEQFGLDFSASDTPYAHAALVEQLEFALATIYGKDVVAAAGLAEAHEAVLHAFVMPGDVLLLESRAGAEFRKAARKVRASRSITIETLPQGASDFDSISAKISEAAALAGSGGKVWFLANAVDPFTGARLRASMWNSLMSAHPALQIYADDSHGVGWFGLNGTGTLFDEIEHKDRLYLSFALSHAFSGDGAAIVTPSWHEALRLRKSAGKNLMMETPVTPAMLAAACESAWLMQTEEAEDLRLILMGKIQRFIEASDELEVPLTDRSESPVFYIRGCGAVTLTSVTRNNDMESLLAAYSLFGNQIELA